MAASVTFLIGWSANAGYRYVGSLLFPVTVERPVALATEFATEAKIGAEFSSDPQYLPTELNLTGEYYILAETLPRGFHDFDYIEIITHEYVPNDETELWVPIPPKGSLQTKRNHKFNSVSVSPDFVTFETESKSGVQYRFVGKYLPYENGEVSNTIRGKLIKLEKGKEASEMKVNLIPGGC